MARRWVFKQHKDQPMMWTWRLLAADGCIEQQASEFEHYGSAVTDAMRNGFHADKDHWIVETAHEVTHHELGKTPLVILKRESKTLLRRPAVAPVKKPSSKSRSRPVGQKQES